jgi:EamA domain-containing membrane protein RarD
LHKEPFVEVLQYHLSPFVLLLLLTFAILKHRLSRASRSAISGAAVGVKWSLTYLL